MAVGTSFQPHAVRPVSVKVNVNVSVKVKVNVKVKVENTGLEKKAPLMLP